MNQAVRMKDCRRIAKEKGNTDSFARTTRSVAERRIGVGVGRPRPERRPVPRSYRCIG